MRIHDKDGTSVIRPLPVMSAAAFSRLQIPQREYLRLPAAAPVSNRHHRRPVIAKTLTATQMNRYTIPLSVYYADAPVAAITTGFKPSAQVEALAQPVLQALGERYAALHFRRIGAAALLSQVKAPGVGARCGLFPAVSMRDLKRWLPGDMPVYFMTDHLDGAYHKRLGKHFTVLTWRQFSPLRRLLEATAPDNYLLAQVEYRIFASARIQVGTHDTNMPPPITRYLMMTGEQPARDAPISLIRDSESHVVHAAMRCERAMATLKQCARWIRRTLP